LSLFKTIRNLETLYEGVSLYKNAIGLIDGWNRHFKHGSRDSLIDDLNAYGGSYSRPNDFLFMLTLPNFIQREVVDMNRLLQVFAKGMNIPSTTLGQKVVRVGASRRSTQGLIDTDTFSLTITDTDQNFFHSIFSSWQHGRTDENGGGAIRYYPDDFKGKGALLRGANTTEINEQRTLYEIYDLIDIYPISVSDIRFDDDEENSLQVFDVTFYVERLQHFKPTAPSPAPISTSFGKGGVMDQIYAKINDYIQG